MRLLIQRVKEAAVAVEGREVARIGAGALILVGVARGDTDQDARYLARKAFQLRIFDDAEGKLNECLAAVGGSFLVVSQFTLYADCAKGNRPSYLQAADPAEAERLYEVFVAALKAMGAEVQTGVFRARMAVSLVNDGPVTIIMESCGRTTA
jgi:D-tyrosyl-tRNA(Tyr) deacylase